MVVQAISRREFRSRYPRDFHHHLISNYETKKVQRETIFENLKKDHQAKMEQYKVDNIYCMKNTTIAKLTTKVAKQCFSRKMLRENKLDDEGSYFLKITSPKGFASVRESSLPSARGAK